MPQDGSCSCFKGALRKGQGRLYHGHDCREQTANTYGTHSACCPSEEGGHQVLACAGWRDQATRSGALLLHANNAQCAVHSTSAYASAAGRQPLKVVSTARCAPARSTMLACSAASRASRASSAACRASSDPAVADSSAAATAWRAASACRGRGAWGHGRGSVGRLWVASDRPVWMRHRRLARGVLHSGSTRAACYW